jgi:endonuclease YncB( thermonuclease family)
MNASPSVASNGQTANGLTTRQHPVHRNTAIGQGAIWDHRHETEHPRMVHSPLRQGDGLAQIRRLIFALTVATIVMPAFAEPIDPADIEVIDGDTLQVHHQHPNVRLVGFNAPEIHNASCSAEAELGARAGVSASSSEPAGSSSNTSAVRALRAHRERSRATTRSAGHCGRTDATSERF